MTKESIVKLRWPIKESFQGYVRGAAGTIEVSDDVTHEGVDFVFPEAEITDTTWSFSGHDDMNAHGGLLAVIIADPITPWAGDHGVISVRTGHDADDLRLDLAEITRVAGTDPLQATAKLTFDGSRLLGDVYRPGQDIDSMQFTD